MPRPTWDEYFIKIAFDVAERATCLRRKVGAILVKQKRILATGYNGAPSGLPHCEEVGCIREQKNVPSGQRHELCRGLHAEMNAFLQAAVHGVSTQGSTLYVTNYPCSICAKMIINAGVERVVEAGHYPDELSRELLSQGGVQVEHVDYPREPAALAPN